MTITIPSLIEACYILSAALFILGMKKLSLVRTARRGNGLAATGMLLACVVTLIRPDIINYTWIFVAVAVGAVIGAVTSMRVKMTAMPQLVAVFNGFGGLASALVAGSEFVRVGFGMSAVTLVVVILGTVIGTITFTGSLIAFMKLQGLIERKPIVYPLQNIINLSLAIAVLAASIYLVLNPTVLWCYGAIALGAAILGVLLVLPIGGADMPVIISFLNSCSGVAAAMTGFVLLNNVLIVAGSLVGAAGLILTNIMCRAMNRSLANVVFGAFGQTESLDTVSKEGQDYESVKSTTSEEAAMILESSSSVIIVPGYGLAASRAQHAIGEVANFLESRSIDVKYAIHPVAGRMPGHMNVLLAEANVPYDKLYEMDSINSEFSKTDVALVIGANDVCNPVAHTDPNSPIYGMPILNVDQARPVTIPLISLASPNILKTVKSTSPQFGLSSISIFLSIYTPPVIARSNAPPRHREERSDEAIWC